MLKINVSRNVRFWEHYEDKRALMFPNGGIISSIPFLLFTFGWGCREPTSYQSQVAARALPSSASG
ncbi:hypothetical protein NPS33_27965, partial [Pseudomonas putida]|uniref:hypothetical protein n=1 Tax=Pseudomonas putida TaxID=303 RepID=UPI0023632684